MSPMNQAKNSPIESGPLVWLKRSASLAVFGAVVLVLSALLSVSPLQASLPVIDVAALGQMLQQYEQLTQQLQTMYQQVALLQDQIQAVTGHYGYGALTGRVNTWGSSSWQEIVAMVNQGVNPGDAAAVQAFESAKTQYQATYPAMATGLLPQNPRLASVYAGDYQTAMTGLGVGQATFNSIQAHLADLQTYKDRIEHTDNLKAAMDLNTAVNVEAAQLNAELLRTNAVALNVESTKENDLTSGQAAQTEFFAN